MEISGWPFCERCQRPVDRLDRRDDVMTGAVLFTAHCHGEKETSALRMQDFVNATSIEIGKAFALPAHLLERHPNG